MMTDTQTAFVLVPRELFTYQRTFDAIAAATSLNEVGIGISVKAFIEAFGPLSAAPKPPESEIGPVAWAVRGLPGGFRRYSSRFPHTNELGETVEPLYPQARIDADAAEKAELLARVKELEDALTPSAETKAAYMGEFTIAIERVVNIDDEPDDEAEGATDPYEHISVPWTTIKEIMTAIRALASKKGL